MTQSVDLCSLFFICQIYLQMILVCVCVLIHIHFLPCILCFSFAVHPHYFFYRPYFQKEKQLCLVPWVTQQKWLPLTQQTGRSVTAKWHCVLPLSSKGHWLLIQLGGWLCKFLKCFCCGTSQHHHQLWSPGKFQTWELMGTAVASLPASALNIMQI